MSFKDTVKQRAPQFALHAYRERATWSSLLRSPNKGVHSVRPTRPLLLADPGH